MPREPVKLDPIFGTMFGDHAEDCACDVCVQFQRLCAESMGRLADVRESLAALAPEGPQCCQCDQPGTHRISQTKWLCDDCVQDEVDAINDEQADENERARAEDEQEREAEAQARYEDEHDEDPNVW